MEDISFNIKDGNKFSPYDLLPVPIPYKDTTTYNDLYFYNNVVKHLVVDFIRMMNNGIPINLGKVIILEELIDNVIDTAQTKLNDNPLIQKYLQHEDTQYKTEYITNLQNNKKTKECFKTEFNPKNKIHISYVINTYLHSIQRSDLILETWTKKDLKKLNQIISSVFIQNFLNNNITTDVQNHINNGMEVLQTTKYNYYITNKITNKIEDIKTKTIKEVFNPHSTKQVVDLLALYNIKTEAKTKKGNTQVNRSVLENLHTLLTLMIEEKDTNNE